MAVNWDVFKHFFRVIPVLALIIIFIAIISNPIKAEQQRITLATTTSTVDTGLLDAILPEFEKKTGIKVNVISVGTGKAFGLGKNGDVDVLLVHDPKGERMFTGQHYGCKDKQIMHNEFILVGPKDDFAGVTKKKSISIKRAFKLIRDKKVLFISRGDDSGTHRKEKAIWKSLKINPRGTWYKEAGQGMAQVLFMADNQRAYTLTDDATYYALQPKIGLIPMVKGDMILHNPYSIIAVNPKMFDKVNYEGAIKLINFLSSKEGQALIRNYKKNGRQLFYPDIYKK